jgi:hypothetical protein
LISKQQYEAQLQQIFLLLLENKTQEEIARELHISTRTVARYSQRIEKRYGQMQRQKTDNTLFMECQIFKNRMLVLYRGLENVVTSPDKVVSGTERATCAEIAANIAIDVLKLESEGINAVKELINVEKKNTLINNLRRRHCSNNTENNGRDYDPTQEENDPNRKF